MKIKFKLTLGVGLLFLMIVLLSFIGAWYINALKSDTENILAANYNTLEYSRSMLLALDEMGNDSTAMHRFETSLAKQKNNISEIGEKETTQKISDHFQKMKQQPVNGSLQPTIRSDIYEIMRLNMQAIQRKSLIAESTAETATFWIAIAGTLCFLVAFTLLINLPRNIANPIEELTESIKQIADQKYTQRVHFQSHNEYGELANAFNKMAEKLEEYNNSNLSQLLFEKKRIETLINNMTDPVIGLDENHRILFVNHEALKIISTAQENIVGKNALELSVSNDLIRSLMSDLIRNDKTVNTQKPFEKIFANGKESYFQKELLDIAITPTGENTSVLIGHVILLKNITAFKELDVAKTNFISTVSHELKTPISSILLSVKLLENQRIGIINKDQEQLIHNIKDDSERLLKITGELLQMTQVETGIIQLNIQTASPQEIVHYAVEAVKMQAEQKQTTLEINIDNHLPMVQSDPEKTTWVMINLLSNAIRYSSEHAKIIIGAKKKAETVEFSVKDFGKGIPIEYQSKLFDRYFKVPGSQTEGTGLGLSISKDFIEAQGGTIKVESEIGSGSTFTVSLAIA
ncbi:MAG TPA: ATP-binding protein [Cytophagaceae bacterium]|jgi:NtrC-family two-component system sensor histidine kinase KinB|nr:ATP-binding protein [Cytophagaceae bacterium]